MEKGVFKRSEAMASIPKETRTSNTGWEVIALAHPSTRLNPLKNSMSMITPKLTELVSLPNRSFTRL
jgi:hypothetical protein